MNSHFLQLKSNLELGESLAASISTRHNAIRAYLANNLHGVKDSKLIGSMQRQTRIHPGAGKKLDVDILVIMGEFHSWVTSGGITAQNALNTLYAAIHQSDRYSGLGPVQDPPTVTLTYSDDIEVQLVPGYVDHIGRDSLGNFVGPSGRGYWIAKNGGWEMADYDHEAAFISSQNAISNYYLIPVIKMLKAIKRLHFPTFGSFPLEILAAHVVPISVAARQQYNVPITYVDLVEDFFTHAPTWLTNPIAVPGTKSPAIILGQPLATSYAESFRALAEFVRVTKAHPVQADQVAAWKRLFGEQFPATI